MRAAAETITPRTDLVDGTADRARPSRTRSGTGVVEAAPAQRETARPGPQFTSSGHSFTLPSGWTIIAGPVRTELGPDAISAASAESGWSTVTSAREGGPRTPDLTLATYEGEAGRYGTTR